MGLGYRRVKLCHVCYSPNHLIKDCDFHEKKSKQTFKPKHTAPKAVLAQSTAKSNYSKPVWNNSRRVNHDNFSKKERYFPQKQTYRPHAILSKQGLQSTAKPYYPQRKTVTSRGSYTSSIKRPYNNYKSPNATKRWEVKQSIVPSQAVLSSKLYKKRKFVQRPIMEWRPTGFYLDHVLKDTGDYTLKTFEYETPQGKSKSVVTWVPNRA